MSEKTMSFHYGKHHKGYVDNYNKLAEKAKKAFYQGDSKKVSSLKKSLNFNLGGHLNHEFFWENLASTSDGGGQVPAAGSELYESIKSDFGSVDKFISQFTEMATSVFGSGWCWLLYNKEKRNLEIQTTANQDRFDDDSSLVPLMNVDVWEHAYYLDF